MSLKTSLLYLLCGLTLAAPVLAQDEPVPKEPEPAEAKPAPPPSKPAKDDLAEPALHRWGGWTISVAGWDPALIGAEEDIADFDSGGVLQPLVQRSDARVKETFRISYHLPRDKGTVVAQYDAMNSDDSMTSLTPGDFDFFEIRAYPYLAGVFDDGRADGVASSSIRRTREFRIEYQNKAFDTKWARATWGVGYRELTHERGLAITYYALVPNLPPIIPPVSQAGDAERLAPIADTVSQNSNYNGHGLGASLDVEFPLHPRVSIVSGLSLGLTRGTIRSDYTSNTSGYFLGDSTVPMTKDELFALISNPPPPLPPPDHAPSISDISQLTVRAGLTTTNTSQLGESIDIYLGVQVNVWKGLKVFVTARDVSYTNVGQYVVPKPGVTNETTALNAGYEGYNVGLSWRF